MHLIFGPHSHLLSLNQLRTNPEKEAREKVERRQGRKEEKRARREQEAAAEAERQEERDRVDAVREREIAETREELERLRALLSIGGGPGSGPVESVERPRKCKCKAAVKEVTPGPSRPQTESADGRNGGEGGVNTEVDSPVEQETHMSQSLYPDFPLTSVVFSRMLLNPEVEVGGMIR
ncbi:hypothetical protein FB451DRAFT_1436484 [Mycena latifolia]|nr:hypothetical protein FB451DRAFT_1436484 [Mycena latifolia]